LLVAAVPSGMALDVQPPEPPTLAEIDPNQYDDAEVVGDANYRRTELEEFLQAGAWREAFDEWKVHTDIGEAEWAIVEDLDLLDQFDFFWDDFADRVGYHAPGLPEDWRERDLHPDLVSWGMVSGINAAMTELGQVVSRVLKENYIDWEAEYEAPDDLPDFG
jgi:hypothetical protein